MNTFLDENATEQTALGIFEAQGCETLSVLTSPTAVPRPNGCQPRSDDWRGNMP